MSNEESYKAIIRYLTNEKEPYAPGTEGNVKRKIRKAAACYVVRRGTLYYQKKRKDRDEFDELEVVLEAGTRRELIASFHESADGFHFTRDQTWRNISQSYWWRGIFKQVKDYIKECIQCKEKIDRNKSVCADTMEILEQLGIDAPVVDNGNETDDDLSNSEGRSDALPRPTRKKTVPKQELVFVDSKGLVKQESAKHCQIVLEQLNFQRLSNQFCDVTLLIEGEEYKAHKSILAASSEYFRELFIEKGAVSSHEAVVDLSGFNKTSFLPLLEFAYTSVLAFDFCHMADVATLARHLLMNEVLKLCEHVHKQLEERKITVYQKGDIKTVNSRVNDTEVELPMDVNTLENTEAQAIENTADGTITVVLQESVQIPMPAEAPASDMEGETPKEVDVTHTAEELMVQQIQGILDCSVEVSDAEISQVNDQIEAVASSVSIPHLESTENNGQDVPEPPATDEQTDMPAVNGTENENQIKEELPETLSTSDVSKRKRGRPPKLHDKQKTVAVASSSKCLLDDTYKSRLRQRTLAEGGYIRLHKGTEKKLRVRKSILKSATQQVAQKLVKRGRRMQPKRTTVERDDVEVEHKCNECGKAFPKRYTLMMHMMTHNRIKEFKCPLCEKEFLYKASLLSHLLRHKRSHEQIDESPGGRTKRQFICDICGKTLPKPYNLRLHMLKHTGVKPHVCKRLPVGAEKMTTTHQEKDIAGITHSQEEGACAPDVDPDPGSLPTLMEGAHKKMTPLLEIPQDILQSEYFGPFCEFLKQQRVAGGEQRRPPEEVGVPSLGVQTRIKTVKLPVVEMQQELQLPGSATTQEKAGLSFSELQCKQISLIIQPMLNEMSQRLSLKLDTVKICVEASCEDFKQFQAAFLKCQQQMASNTEKVLEVEKSVKELRERERELERKVDYLENQSRRNNVKIVGLPESMEEQDPLHFFTEWIPQILGQEFFSGGLVLERAHRALKRRPLFGQPPRPEIIRCLNYLDRETILHLAVQNVRQRQAPLMIQNSRVFFYPDLSQEVIQCRRRFNPVKEVLWRKGYNSTFRYPAVLVFCGDFQSLFFENEREAMSFADSLPDVRGQRRSPPLFPKEKSGCSGNGRNGRNGNGKSPFP
ncbi:zinc finger and BTB domain-containing protein 11 isoform X1 [Narcine bancroftii]|uniref:zinc finger and BTB domain-containing protein 11 isoform X1 n=1 Tax=Narcine bancroftii TaxID=1343680 RepID=UPI0038318E8E